MKGLVFTILAGVTFGTFAGMLQTADLRLTDANGKVTRLSRPLETQPDGARRLRMTTGELEGLKSVDVVIDAARVPKGEGYWVLGDGHYGRFTRDNGSYSTVRTRLALYGVCRPGASFVAIVKGLRTEYRSQVVAKGGTYEVFPRFEIAKIEFAPYEDIVIDCYPLTGDDANYSGMARKYRAWQLARGEVRPLAEKARESDALAWSAKSIFLRCKFGRTFRRDVDHKSFATNTPPMSVDHTFDDFMDIMRRAKALGMDDVDMCMVGWQREGHDGPFPDHFPVDPRFGGEEKMRETVKLGHDLGYRMSVHLNYHNYYPAARRWRDEDVCKGPDGKPRPYWLLPAGLSHFSCFEVMVNRYVDSDFDRLRDIGIDGILHHDVTSAAYPTPCHDPRHPNDRGRMAGWQLRLCEKCREGFGGSSSESGLDHIARGLDNILYVAWEVKRNALIDGMLPIWPIVYNGICMSQPFYGTMDAPYPRNRSEKFSEGLNAFHWIPTPEERMLKVFEWGGRPAFYYNTYADLLPMKRMYDLWQPLKHLQFVFIHEHAVLSEGVTATRYENGEEVVCNASAKPFAYRGETVAPKTHRLYPPNSVPHL